jgi:tripartite-type tricarboxylate transporter receptor subunit TctC
MVMRGLAGQGIDGQSGKPVGRRRVLSQAAGLTTAGVLPQTALAQSAEWPTRGLRIVVPFGPGSTPDVFARLVAERLSPALKQPVIVENRAGAGGNIGTDAVAKAAPDGYTIGVSITGPLVNNTVLYRSMPYDPFRDLAPVTLGAVQPNVLVVSSDLGVNTLPELMTLLRRHPGRYNFASVGAGTVSHLSMELIKARTGTFIVHVPYNASPAAVMSMLQGDTHMASLAPFAVMPQVKAGKLKAIAVTTRERSLFVPEVPTCRESGLPEIEATAWIGVVVPARTPTAIVHRLNAELVGILKEPAVVDKLRAVYMEPAPGTPQAFAAFMQEELRRWTPVIRRAGVTID